MVAAMGTVSGSSRYNPWEALVATADKLLMQTPQLSCQLPNRYRRIHRKMCTTESCCNGQAIKQSQLTVGGCATAVAAAAVLPPHQEALRVEGVQPAACYCVMQEHCYRL